MVGIFRCDCHYNVFSKFLPLQTNPGGQLKTNLSQSRICNLTLLIDDTLNRLGDDGSRSGRTSDRILLGPGDLNGDNDVVSE